MCNTHTLVVLLFCLQLALAANTGSEKQQQRHEADSADGQQSQADPSIKQDILYPRYQPIDTTWRHHGDTDQQERGTDANQWQEKWVHLHDLSGIAANVSVGEHGAMATTLRHLGDMDHHRRGGTSADTRQGSEWICRCQAHSENDRVLVYVNGYDTWLIPIFLCVSLLVQYCIYRRNRRYVAV